MYSPHMGQSAIGFEVDGQSVDGVVAFPTEGLRPFPGVLLCHPHPLFGGNMHNVVVVAIASALAARGIASLRFNFRTPGGVPEHQARLTETAMRDVAQAFRVMRGWDGIRRGRVGVAGYSFGASIIARSVNKLGDAKAIALVSPTLVSLRESEAARDSRPYHFVVGGNDKLVNPQELEEMVSGMGGEKRLETIKGADHSLHGHEAAVGDRVADFMASHIS